MYDAIHYSEHNESWPCEFKELEDQERRELWFICDENIGSSTEEISFHIYNVMNAHFIRRHRTRDQRLAGEKDGRIYVRFLYQEKMTYISYPEFVQNFSSLYYVHLKGRDYDVVRCWSSWFLIQCHKRGANFRFTSQDSLIIQNHGNRYRYTTEECVPESPEWRALDRLRFERPPGWNDPQKDQEDESSELRKEKSERKRAKTRKKSKDQRKRKKSKNDRKRKKEKREKRKREKRRRRRRKERFTKIWWIVNALQGGFIFLLLLYILLRS